MVAQIKTTVKCKAAEDLFRPASAIVDEVLLEQLNEEACPTLPGPERLARAANRFRQAQRPVDPVDLNFSLDENNLPENFLRGDIDVRGRRHLIFATEEQLATLSRAKRWYVDGTFKLCRQPFTQLFTINAFVKQENNAKQVPLVFVLMSGRRKKDYKKVLKLIREILPTPPQVQQVTVDFEKAVWSAFRKVMPEVHIMGCSFHWNQAVWRKVQELGLQTAYMKDQAINRYIRRIMALPFLPYEVIPTVYQSLRDEVSTEPLEQLAEYVGETWVRSNLHSPGFRRKVKADPTTSLQAAASKVV